MDFLGQLVHDRYAIQALVGEGADAMVYRADDQRLGRLVAVKFLRPELRADPTFVARFEREARSVARLDHPGIVPVYDYGEYSDTYFLVLQYVAGKDLRARLRDPHPLPLSEAVQIAAEAADALGAAHAHGIVHRDVKPANILLDAQGHARVTDFGVARMLDAPGLTATRAMIGTPHYLAPEQATSGPITPATDVYALGTVLFEMLTGRRPFRGDTFVQVVVQHAQEPAPPVEALNPAVPPALAALVARALAKDPAERFADGSEFAAALRAQLPDLLAAERADASNPPPAKRSPAAVPDAAAATAVPAALAGAAGVHAAPFAGRPAAAPDPPVAAPAGRTAQLPDATPWPAATAAEATRHLPDDPVAGGPARTQVWTAPPVSNGSQAAAGTTAGSAAPSASILAGASRRRGAVVPILLLAAAAVLVVGWLASMLLGGGRVISTEPTRGILPTPTRVATALPAEAETDPPADASSAEGAPVAVLAATAAPAAPTSEPTAPPSAVPTTAATVRPTEPPATAPPATTAPATAAPAPTRGNPATAPVPLVQPTRPPAATSAPEPTVAPTAPPATEAPAPPILAINRQVVLDDDAFTGGYSAPRQYRGRTARWLYGANSPYGEMTASFRLDSDPGAGLLQIIGLDSENGPQTPIEILVNDRSVYRGGNPLPKDTWRGDVANWGEARIPIPRGVLHGGSNTLTFRNLAPVNNFNSPPYFMLDQAILTLGEGG